MHFPQRKSFRTTSNYLLAGATELASVPLRLGARMLVPTRPVPPSQWKRVLILGNIHIGDLLYQTCSLAQLKKGLPNCELHYLAAENALEVLKGNPSLDSILPLRKSDRMFDLKAEALETLKRHNFDAILCTNAVRGWPQLAFALRLRIPNRAAYGHRGFSGLITHPVLPKFPQAFPGYFRDMVAALTGRTPDWPLRPVVYPDATDRAQAEKLWSELKLNSSEPVLACFVKSRQPNGAWPVEWFGEALRLVQNATRCRVLLCGTTSDRPELERIHQQFGLSADVIPGVLGVMALAAFLAKCSVVLSQDSGPRHIANAVNVPVVFVRNMWAEAVETGAYCDTETDLAPKEVNRVPLAHQAAMVKRLSPQIAADAVQLRIKSQ